MGARSRARSRLWEMEVGRFQNLRTFLRLFLGVYLHTSMAKSSQTERRKSSVERVHFLECDVTVMNLRL